MPDADPKSDWKVRGMPQSVRLWYHGQAAARGLTLAGFLTMIARGDYRWNERKGCFEDIIHR